MDHKEKINIINKAYSDTNFLINKPLFINGIKLCIKGWVEAIIFSNLILFLYTVLLQHLAIFEADTFYKMYNILYVTLNIFPLFIYLFFLIKRNISLKEKHFLRFFFIVPVLFFINKIIFPVSFYFNFDYLLSLYDSVSLELIATLVATLMFYYFFKKIKYLYLSCFTFLYVVMSSFIKIICLNSNSIDYVVIKLFNFVDFVHTYSIFSMIIFLFIIYFISKEQNEIQFVKCIQNF